MFLANSLSGSEGVETQPFQRISIVAPGEIVREDGCVFGYGRKLASALGWRGIDPWIRHPSRRLAHDLPSRDRDWLTNNEGRRALSGGVVPFIREALGRSAVEGICHSICQKIGGD